MKYLRWLLLPFSLVYALVVIIRNWCYDTGVFKSRVYNFPVISVGNLSIGGAGKSPMTEYLIRLLKPHYQLATLSRGYGRQTKGFLLAEPASTAVTIGDEPAQFKQKFPEVTVAVCEKRATGIERLMPGHQVIVLDDAYQHRAVRPGYSILLFDYNSLNEPNWVLPAGNLREPYSGRQRANILVVSKCPPDLTTSHQERISKQVRPYAQQQVFFTSISYQPLQNMQHQPVNGVLNADTTVFLLTGIANTKPLLQHIQQYTANIVHHNYPDHHQFSLKNIAKLADDFARCTAPKKVIITTEKDAQRLREPALLTQMQQLPVWVLPIGIKFLNNGQQPFNQMINSYVREYTTYHQLH